MRKQSERGSVAAASPRPRGSAQQRGASQGDEMVFGMPTDLSGLAATYGVSSSNGVKMRFDEVNEAGRHQRPQAQCDHRGPGLPGAEGGAGLQQADQPRQVFAFVGPLGTPMNNACFKDQFAAGVPNLLPLSAARSMYEPFEKLKFYGAASYVDQIRSGINYFVKKRARKPSA